MTSIEQALYTVIALVILIGIVYLFFSVFGSTECDNLSNATAVELTNAINKVALGQGVLSWDDSTKPPPDENTGYYTTASVRLCEKNRMNTLSALFSAQSPTYIITYESFPEAGYAWSESQPFSGGAPESLLNYAVMKYGLKFGSIVGKLVAKVAKTLWNGDLFLIKLKIYRWFEASRIKRWLDNNKYYNAVKNYLKRHFSSSTQTTVQETIEGKLNKKNYPKEYKGLIDQVKDYVKNNFLSEEEALVKADVIEGAYDETTGRWIPKKLFDMNTGNGQYIVKQKYRKFMQIFIENTGEASDMYKSLYHIPFKWSTVENFKLNVWRPFKYSVKSWWKNTWFKKSIDRIKKFYDDKIGGKIQAAKDTWNDWMNHKETLGLYDVPQDIGANKNYAMLHRDEITKEVKDNFNEFSGPLNEITGKVFTKADDVTDEDVIKLINNYERYYNAKALIMYLPHEQDNLAEAGARFFGQEYFNRAEKVRDTVFTSTDIAAINAAWKDYDSLLTPVKNLDPAKKAILMDKISAGFTKPINEQTFDELYEYARVSAFKNGAFSHNNLNLLVSQADKVKADMNLAPIYLGKKFYTVERLKVTDRFLTPIITDQSFSKFKTLTSYGWKRLKRGVFIDMNRVGQGPIAPYNLVGFLGVQSPYSINQALQQASAIQEGGCSNNAICRIMNMGAQGPTETATSYLLDRRVPDSIEVKTWRPKPDWTARTPIGINTLSFYLSVPQNPTFHVVGPCFGIAKVWKSGGTVYVSIEKDKKCNVNCTQENIQLSTPSSIGIPFTDWNIGLPSVNLGTVGPTDKDTPNYCYADEEFIWGEGLSKGNLLTTGDVPSEVTYLGGYTACVIACSAATHGTGLKTCLKSCGYAAIGILTVNTLAATQTYRDVPSWERQETGWGYWNYQKAMDICDTIDFISSFGSFNTPTQKVQALPGVGFKEVVPVQTGRLQKVLSTSGKYVQNKISKYTTMGIGDICTAIQLIGDTSLSWPIKAPVPEFWKKAAVLDEKCMQDSASQCAWLRRCDPITSPCAAGFDCIEGVCKKQGSWVI